MNRRLMNYRLSHQNQEKFYLFHTTLWSFPEFTRIPSDTLLNLDTTDMTRQIMGIFSTIEENFFEQEVFNFLGYSESGFLTDLIDQFEAKIVTVQFSKLYESPNLTEFPHVLIVDIFLCDKEVDFASLHRNTTHHDGSSTTFELL